MLRTLSPTAGSEPGRRTAFELSQRLHGVGGASDKE